MAKAKSVFPTDDSLFKMLYLAMMDITKNGLVGGRIGAGFMRNSLSILPTVCRINRLQRGKSRVEMNGGSCLRP